MKFSSCQMFNNAVWTKKANHRTFFDKLGQELGFQCTEDWYRLTKEDIEQHGGGRLLKKRYGNSVYTAMSQLYPQHKWLPWRFDEYIIDGYWESKANQR